MIVTKHFVYIHTSRHAGTFLNKLFLEHVPDARMIQYHGHLRDLPKKYSKLPVIGFVRNPWDWYVSMYHNYKHKQQYIFQIVADQGSLDFETTVMRYLSLGDKSHDSKHLLEKIIQEAPTQIDTLTNLRVSRPGLTKQDFKKYPNGVGYYSWLFRHMHEVNGKIKGHFGKFENLRKDVKKILQKTGTPISKEMLSYIDSMEPLNSSARDPKYRNYYSDSLKTAVAKSDRYIIEKFGYKY